MAERRRQRAKASEQSEREKKNGAGELPHLDAKLRGCDVVEKAKRGGGATRGSELCRAMAARARFREGGGCGFGLGFQGGAALLL